MKPREAGGWRLGTEEAHHGYVEVAIQSCHFFQGHLLVTWRSLVTVSTPGLTWRFRDIELFVSIGYFFLLPTRI